MARISGRSRTTEEYRNYIYQIRWRIYHKNTFLNEDFKTSIAAS